MVFSTKTETQVETNQADWVLADLSQSYGRLKKDWRFFLFEIVLAFFIGTGKKSWWIGFGHNSSTFYDVVVSIHTNKQTHTLFLSLYLSLSLCFFKSVCDTYFFVSLSIIHTNFLYVSHSFTNKSVCLVTSTNFLSLHFFSIAYTHTLYVSFFICLCFSLSLFLSLTHTDIQKSDSDRRRWSLVWLSGLTLSLIWKRKKMFLCKKDTKFRSVYLNIS